MALEIQVLAWDSHKNGITTPPSDIKLDHEQQYRYKQTITNLWKKTKYIFILCWKVHISVFINKLYICPDYYTPYWHCWYKGFSSVNLSLLYTLQILLYTILALLI